MMREEGNLGPTGWMTSTMHNSTMQLHAHNFTQTYLGPDVVVELRQLASAPAPNLQPAHLFVPWLLRFVLS